MRFILVLACLAFPSLGTAQTQGEIIRETLESHILPGFERLTDTTRTLRETAGEDCASDSEALRGAYHDAFDAWLGVSHLRFGPVEADSRGFALAFWPDARGSTPKTLVTLIRNSDPIAASPEDFRDVSVAVRGLYALEFLLYDPAISTLETGEYRCLLTQAIATDMALTAQDILDGWTGEYSDTFLNPGPDGLYLSNEEVLQELFGAISSGLEFTADVRIGRPMGTFERPRPKRAEARRSGRSLHNVTESLTAMRGLALHLSAGQSELQGKLTAAFDTADEAAQELGDPVFAGVSEPSGRLRVETLQQSVNDIRALASSELGPALGIAAGFNSLDGD